MAKRSDSVPSGPHVVVTGDIVASRRVVDRAALQERLRKLLAGLNRRHSPLIVVPFTLSGGDEFQGVAKPGGRILALADDIARELHPVRVRLGMGVGRIGTPFAERSQEMDGEAFVFSREAVERARELQAPLWFRTPDPVFDLSANSVSLLFGEVQRRWKSIHWRRSALRNRGWTVKRIAQHEGVSPGAISLSLRGVGYPVVRLAMDNLTRLWEQRLG